MIYQKCCDMKQLSTLNIKRNDINVWHGKATLNNKSLKEKSAWNNLYYYSREGNWKSFAVCELCCPQEAWKSVENYYIRGNFVSALLYKMRPYYSTPIISFWSIHPCRHETLIDCLAFFYIVIRMSLKHTEDDTCCLQYNKLSSTKLLLVWGARSDEGCYVRYRIQTLVGSTSTIQ